MAADRRPLRPGSVIGILGGGQLGRLLALAAAELGFSAHIYTPERDSPAAQVAGRVTIGGWRDEAALASFAAAVDVITYEFENIPVETVQFLAARRPVLPDAEALATGQ